MTRSQVQVLDRPPFLWIFARYSGLLLCYNYPVSLLDGRWRGIASREESPGSVGQRQSLTATGSNPRESVTETKPPHQLLSYFGVGKGEKSGVRAHSSAWWHAEGVNPVGCKEIGSLAARQPIANNPHE